MMMMMMTKGRKKSVGKLGGTKQQASLQQITTPIDRLAAVCAAPTREFGSHAACSNVYPKYTVQCSAVQHTTVSYCTKKKLMYS